MSASSIFRITSRARTPALRAVRRPIAPKRAGFVTPVYKSFSSTARQLSDSHGEETFEEFTARYEKEFENVTDVFELQRNLNNAFAYDLVPSPTVLIAALRAARRINDFPTAIRVFEGIKAKVENPSQYEEYLKELEPIREELGVPLREDIYPDINSF
ncbi:COX5A-domain-containing protein [Pseudovirgaria hyperparasitica]|uniref:Cytochrome c oxidase subunit 6, mitochondrial n=1 Tax=Pseudovirgaria hyperparasitica TaxID=470096 RepID=A0A6A6VX83_9PEZI|nr:COX5A-domain-containing protein [Pseudovirgaria hyperparasitica]KAF2754785.1 COX5A-domain-containing protein [Pseudovirgaria hyperparasitica]